MDESQPVNLLVAHGKMVVFNEDTLTAFQLLEANFPAWQAILPPSFKYTMPVAYAEVERSIRQALVVAKASGSPLSNSVSIAADDHSVIVVGQDGEGSKSQAVLNSDLVAKTQFTVNGVFVLQTLKALTGAKKGGCQGKFRKNTDTDLFAGGTRVHRSPHANGNQCGSGI